ncbi:DUF881 domain-containing protein [Georgenia faecalis]|uniref:DUF881 domain-containing protein n=1 Tax=Georgenia faecalis TaxID=2483799 RepID=UPI000FD99D0D|nr:DUF881 domain-containing protein [Georgenia faecalis]
MTVRRDVSMTLLREVTERPLDPGYAEAAARKARGEAPMQPVWRRVVVVVLAAVLGMGSVWAARELRAPQESTTQARTLLMTEIAERGERREAMLADNAATTAQIQTLQQQGLEGADDSVVERLALLGVGAGTAAVSGPGVVVTLDDSAEAQEGLPGSEQGYVLDRDLQVVTNELWSGGAEAVAINGHRLTTLSAIRSAGRAILADLAPLARPYVVEAIGDPTELQESLARSSAGAHLALLRDTYGITVDIRREDRLELPASPVRILRYAQALEGEG